MRVKEGGCGYGIHHRTSELVKGNYRMPSFEDIKGKLAGHEDKVEQGVDKAADVVKGKLGHDEQVDKGADAAKNALGSTDQ